MSLFGNRVVQVKLTKDQNSNGKEIVKVDPNHNPLEGVEVAAAYAAVGKDLITHASLTIGGVFIVCKIVERICR